MGLAQGWLLAPVALAAVCCGVGLLIEVAGGLRVPGTLVPALGLAGTCVIAAVLVAFEPTARLAVPAVAVTTGAGIVLGRPWRDPRLACAWPWPILLGLAAFVLSAAPSIFSGQGSVAGYVKLDDSVTWMAIVDRALSHSRDVAVGPGSYGETLRAWLGNDYPLGGLLPFGITSRLTGQDMASVYQPSIAVVVAICALGLNAIAATVVRSRALAAAVALAAVQASLFAGYTQWGGVKEACVAALLAPVAWLAVSSRRNPAALIVVAAAICAALGVNGVVWAGPALLLGVVLAWRAGLRSPVAVGALIVLAVVAFLPELVALDFAKATTVGAAGSLGDADELGNLRRALPLLQGAGLWPVGDFRFDTPAPALATILALGCLAASLGAAVVAARRGAWSVTVLLAFALTGTAVAVSAGSAWVDAKALAVCAPMVLLAAGAFAAMGLERSGGTLQSVSVAGSAVLIAGCVWSGLVVFRDVLVAPRERMAELRDLGDAMAGLGPTLQLDFDTYADRWFLRDASVDAISDLRTGNPQLVDGTQIAPLTTVDSDRIVAADLWAYRTLVRRRSPVASRPPSGYELALSGEHWEAWTRQADDAVPLARLPLGNGASPISAPQCEAVRSLSRTPGARTLVGALRLPVLVTPLTSADMPPAWLAAEGLQPRSDGDAIVTFEVPATATWRVWVEGSVRGRLEVLVDGRSAGSVRHEVSYSGQWMAFGAPQMTAGKHQVALRYRRGGFAQAGRGGDDFQFTLTRIALAPVASETPGDLVKVGVARYNRLCDGRSYDWIDAR